MAFPVFGGLLYLLFGGVRLSKRTRKRMERLTELQQETMGDGEAVLAALPDGEESVKAQSRYIARASLFPPHLDTQTWYYPTGEALYARMAHGAGTGGALHLSGVLHHPPGREWDGLWRFWSAMLPGVDVRVL